jgi:hypothetical protein
VAKLCNSYLLLGNSGQERGPKLLHPGGFLYRKDPGAEEVGGFFCGYLTDEVWHHRTDDG